MQGSLTWSWPLCSSGLQQLVDGDRQRSDASAGGVVHGVGDGGDTPTTPISPMPLIPIGRTVSGSPTKTTSTSGTSALTGIR